MEPWSWWLQLSYEARYEPRPGLLSCPPSLYGQENVPGGQVAVDDGWRVAVKEGEAASDVVKDRTFQADGDEGLGRRLGLGVQHLVKARQQLLHDQRGHSAALQEAHAEKLDDVRVAEGAHQLTFPHELARRSLDAFSRHLARVLEEIVYFLGRTHGAWYGHLLHAAIGTGAYRSARGPRVGEEKRS